MREGAILLFLFINFRRAEMSNELIINFLGIVIGTFGGIVASSRLTNYRIEQLEKKVDKHNSIIERTYILDFNSHAPRGA